MKNVKILYHAGCADGWCSAWVAARFLKLDEYDLIPCSYGRPAPIELSKEDTVYLVDFSYPREELVALAERVKHVVVLDHHKSAQLELQDMEFDPRFTIVFDMKRSGAVITYDYFQNEGFLDGGVRVHVDTTSREWSFIRMVCRYVQDRDLWQWELDRSREFSAYLESLPKTLRAWSNLFHMTEEGEDYDELFATGKGILEYTKRKVEALTRPGCFIVADFDLTGEVCYEGIALINICIAAPGSEILGKLAEGHEFACGWYQKGDGSYYYSLRSVEGGVDVGAFAAHLRKSKAAFAGGGHERAAGFSSYAPPDEIFTYIQE